MFDVHEVCNVSEFDTCVFVFVPWFGVCVDERRFEAEVCVVNEVVVEFDLVPGFVPVVGEDVIHVCFLSVVVCLSIVVCVGEVFCFEVLVRGW